MYNFVELSDVLLLIRRRWWLLVLAALIGGELGYGLTLQQTPVYAAKTTLFVGRSIQAEDLDRTALQTGQQLAITYAEIVRRQPVLQGAIDALQLPTSWQALRSRIKVGQVGETQLIEITAEAPSPAAAEQLAAEVARQLILLSPTAGGVQSTEDEFQFFRQRLLAVQTSIVTMQNELQTLQDTLEQLDPTSIQAGATRLRRTELENRLLELDNLYARLLDFIRDMQASNQVTMIEPAQAQANPVRPSLTLNVIVGAFGLLVLVLLLVFFWAYRDDRFRSADEMVQQTGLALLGNVRQMAGKAPTDRLMLRQDPYTQTTEDYRLVYSKVQFALQQLPHKLLLITSPTAGDGKSLVAANLAMAMAEAGRKVILIDANFRRPTLHEIFGIANTNGLAELLHAPYQQPDLYLKPTIVPNLQLITTGMASPHSLGLLGAPPMQDLLDYLADKADMLICDSAEATGIADAAMLARQVAGIIVVIRDDHMKRTPVNTAIKNLAQVGGNLVGLIINQPTSGLGPKRQRSAQSTPLPTPLASPRNAEVGDD